MDKLLLISSLNTCTDIQRTITCKFIPFAMVNMCECVHVLTDHIFARYGKVGCKKSDYKEYVAQLRKYSSNMRVLDAILRRIYPMGTLSNWMFSEISLTVRSRYRDSLTLIGYFDFTREQLDNFRIRKYE